MARRPKSDEILRALRPTFLCAGDPFSPPLYTNVFAQPAPSKDTKAKERETAKAADAAPVPSDKGIADAKAKGMVWINLGTGVYHREGKLYGKTKHGKFMSEDHAKKPATVKRRPKRLQKPVLARRNETEIMWHGLMGKT